MQKNNSEKKKKKKKKKGVTYNKPNKMQLSVSKISLFCCKVLCFIAEKGEEQTLRMYKVSKFIK